MKNNFYFVILAGTVVLAATIILINKTHLLDKLFTSDNLTGDLDDYDSVVPQGEEKNVEKKFR